MAKEASSKRQFHGVVVSVKQQNTAVVRVDRTVVNPRYKKRYIVGKKYACDSRNQDLRLGDKVTFIETRPLSKTKRWRVVGKI